MSARSTCAAEFARAGYHVVFLQPGRKQPSGANWQQRATTDPDEVARHFARTPEANWGVLTGAGGLTVVDLDVKNGEDGPGEWAKLTPGLAPPALRVRTPSGGLHHYWLAPGVRNGQGSLAPGVDVRGDGGLVVGPGSVVGGGEYELLSPLVPRAELLALPADAAALLVGRRAKDSTRSASTALGPVGVEAALVREVLAVGLAAEGTRNAALNAAAYNLGQLVGPSLTADRVKDALSEAANAAGLGEDETAATVASGLAKGQANARTVATPEQAADQKHAQAVEQALERRRANHEAEKLWRDELAQSEQGEPFDAGTLAEVLARPDEESYRVEGLVVSEGSTLIVAKRKTGKTTLNLNLAKCLIDGSDFLGQFKTHPVQGRVAILNFEVSGSQLARWASEAGVNPERLFLVNLRGKRNPLSHPGDRAELASLLRAQEVEALFVDPFGRAYSGDQNSAGEVSAWLVDLDLFARAEAGARDLFLNVHAGWNGERSRGSSALEDWPDTVLNLTRKDDDDTGPRYFAAFGRDVDVPEDELAFDGATRHLYLTGSGSRREARASQKTESLVQPVLDVVGKRPGLTSRGLAPALREFGYSGFRKGDEARALLQAVERGLVVRQSGPNNSFAHFLPGAPQELFSEGDDPAASPREVAPVGPGLGIPS